VKHILIVNFGLSKGSLYPVAELGRFFAGSQLQNAPKLFMKI
jgi:hypothetical protein